MSRNISRQEAIRIAAEKVRQKKEQEEREDREFYERITSGKQWLIFKIVVGFCTLMALITIIETLFDGPSKQLTQSDWKIDREWEYQWHEVLDVQGYMFAPEFKDWYGHDTSTLELVYTPIFRTGKKLSYDIKNDGEPLRKHEELRMRSIFTWFPFIQLFMLIPLATFIFKRQSPWFSFARIASLGFVLPGTILLIYFTLM